MIEITGKMCVQCEKCGCKNELSPDQLDYECDSEEKNMGERVATWRTAEIFCEKCNAEITVKVNSWEYPVNFLEDSEQVASGGKILEEFDIHVAPEPIDEIQDCR